MAPTILCADDDRHYCQILSRAFEQHGYRVETAHDGDEALEKIRTLQPNLITLDLMLPKRDGFEVLETVRSSGANQTPVVLVSGCTLAGAYEDRANELGANAMLQKPVPLDRLLGVVAEHVQQTPVDPSQETGPIANAIHGNLEEVPLAPLLQQLRGLRASGVLQLQSGKKRKQIQLREGLPVSVRSNLVNETLGHLLLATGKIDEEALHASTLRVKNGEGMQGQILKAMHMLDDADLATALRNQASEKLLDAFSWPKGRFRFHSGARLRSANALSLKTSAGRIVMQGVQERAPIQTIDRFLMANAEKAAVPSESPFRSFQDVELDARANELLHRMNGQLRLDQLGPLDDAQRRSLYGLLVLDLLELREAKPAPRHVAARGPQPIRDSRREDALIAPGTEEPAVDERVLRQELVAMAEAIDEQDAFKILGVERRSTDDEIRTAYAALAKRTHPDRFVGASDALVRLAEDVFGQIAAAYDSIGETEHRMQYLRKLQGRDAEQKELEIGQRAVRAELAFQKGETALRSNQVQAAFEHFKEAAETYPEEGEYLAHWGWTFYLVDPEEPGRIERATAMVQKGRKLAPDREKPYLFLGRLCQAQGRADSAEKLFMRAVQLDPDCVEALRELRLIDMRREKSKGLVQRILRR